MDEAAIARQMADVDVAEVVVVVAVAGGTNDVAVVQGIAEGDNDGEIVPAQEKHDVVGQYNSADCSPNIDCFDTANVADRGLLAGQNVAAGAE